MIQELLPWLRNYPRLVCDTITEMVARLEVGPEILRAVREAWFVAASDVHFDDFYAEMRMLERGANVTLVPCRLVTHTTV